MPYPFHQLTTYKFLTMHRPVPLGAVAYGGQSSYLMCPPGQYRDAIVGMGGAYGTGTYGQTWCQNCPTGTFSVHPGSTACLPVPAGTYPTPDKSATVLCPAGYFSSTGSGTCTKCPVGESWRECCSTWREFCSTWQVNPNSHDRDSSSMNHPASLLFHPPPPLFPHSHPNIVFTLHSQAPTPMSLALAPACPAPREGSRALPAAPAAPTAPSGPSRPGATSQRCPTSSGTPRHSQRSPPRWVDGFGNCHDTMGLMLWLAYTLS